MHQLTSILFVVAVTLCDKLHLDIHDQTLPLTSKPQ